MARRDRQESMFELSERNLFKNREKATPDVVVKSMDEIINDNDYNFLKDIKLSMLSKPRHMMEKFRRGDVPFYDNSDELLDTQIKLTGESPGTNNIVGSDHMGGDGEMRKNALEALREGNNKEDENFYKSANIAVELSKQVKFPRPINTHSKRRGTSRTNDVALLQNAIANYRQRQNVFNVVPSGNLKGGYGADSSMHLPLGDDFRMT